jgi:hypothetical protein
MPVTVGYDPNERRVNVAMPPLAQVAYPYGAVERGASKAG